MVFAASAASEQHTYTGGSPVGPVVPQAFRYGSGGATKAARGGVGAALSPGHHFRRPCRHDVFELSNFCKLTPHPHCRLAGLRHNHRHAHHTCSPLPASRNGRHGCSKGHRRDKALAGLPRRLLSHRWLHFHLRHCGVHTQLTFHSCRAFLATLRVVLMPLLSLSTESHAGLLLSGLGGLVSLRRCPLHRRLFRFPGC